MMKKSILIAALGLFSLDITIQDAPKEERLIFTIVKESPITSTRDQSRSSTYWSFSSLGFLESELLCMGKGEYDLSEMFVVHRMVIDRIQNYVCYHSDSSSSPGGSFYDIVFCLENYDPVPQEAMPDIIYDNTLPVHNGLDAVIGTYTNAIARGKFTKLSPIWKSGSSAIYDTRLGKCSERFTHKGEEYTPETFGESSDISPDDHVSLTSYIHHPFYIQLTIEIQDSWCNGLSWNLPIDKLMVVMDNAVKKGYAFAWESDVSERGFTRDGIVIMSDAVRGAKLTGSDMARWTGLTVADKRKELISKPLSETNVIQEMRQATFDNWETTDDYGVVIYGIAKD